MRAAACACPPPGAPVGRFGGPPRLPVGTSWPDNGDGSLAFVFSVDCAALPRVDGLDLPVDGSLDLEEHEILPFHEQLAQELRSSMPHLDDLDALTEELWPPSSGLASGFLGGYTDDEVLWTMAEEILREREKSGGTTIPQDEWFDHMAVEQRRLSDEWMSLATFMVSSDYYHGRMSIRRDDLAAGRLDRMLSMTEFTE